MSSIHLFLGLPLFLLPIGFHSSTLLGILFFFHPHHVTQQSHSFAFHKSYYTENVVNPHIHGVYDAETESTLILFSNEALCHLSKYMNSQNYRSPSLNHEVPLTWHTGWHMVCWVQMELSGPFLLWGHKSTLSCNIHSDTIFWKLSSYKRIYACLQQDSAVAHTTNITCIFFHSCIMHLDIISLYFTNGCTIYLLRGTLKFTLKLPLHVSV